MNDLIERAEAVACELDNELRDGTAQTIRDLIAALRAAPTADDLRGWANHLAGNWTRDAVILELRRAADRMGDAVSASDTMGE